MQSVNDHFYSGRCENKSKPRSIRPGGWDVSANATSSDDRRGNGLFVELRPLASRPLRREEASAIRATRNSAFLVPPKPGKPVRTSVANSHSPLDSAAVSHFGGGIIASENR
jgi:hypothetical protein